MTSSKTTNLIDMMTKYFYRLNDPITMNKLFSTTHYFQFVK